MTVAPSAIAACSLFGGYCAARFSGKRPLGGVVLAIGGAAAGYQWYQQAGAGATAANIGIYLAAFGISHPLAKRIGAWPSVISVSNTTAVATAVVTQLAIDQQTA